MREDDGVEFCQSSHLSLLLVILRAIDLAGQAEIGHFDDVVVHQENVTSGQITVQHLGDSLTLINSIGRRAKTKDHYFALGQVRHSARDLERPADEVFGGNRLSGLIAVITSVVGPPTGAGLTAGRRNEHSAAIHFRHVGPHVAWWRWMTRYVCFRRIIWQLTRVDRRAICGAVERNGTFPVIRLVGVGAQHGVLILKT